MKNSIIESLEFASEKGALSYKGVRYFLIRPETVMDLQKSMEKELGKKSGEILYQSGFLGGSLSGKKYREVFGFSLEETIRFMIKMGREIGWGYFDLDELDVKERFFVIRLNNSPFAQAYGPSDHPVCHMIRGVFGGLGQGIFQAPVVAEETLCEARGDPFCRFSIRSVAP